MIASWREYGPWGIRIAARHVLCPDGRRRYARVIGQPDTFFSQPASVCYRGCTIHGYIAGRETDGARDLEFRVDGGYRNSHMFAADGYPNAALDAMD